MPPLPPIELMRLVGPTDESFYCNPSGDAVFAELPRQAFDCVFDFGCGCGRLARQLIQQRERPRRYLGVDLHRGMIEWCKRNLAPYAPEFEFHHQDIWNRGLNPRGTKQLIPFPVGDRLVTLFIAWSVFTHVNETAAVFYLRELARVLYPEGVAVTTWFLFNKDDFPMMQEFQNALFINDADPTNAVIFDKHWLQQTADRCGLVLSQVEAPTIRGFQWQVRLERVSPGRAHAHFPEDAAPRGVERPPLLPADAASLGLVETSEDTGAFSSESR